MKKIIILPMAAAILAASCARDIASPLPADLAGGYTLVLEQAQATKANVDSFTGKMTWSSSEPLDQVRVVTTETRTADNSPITYDVPVKDASGASGTILLSQKRTDTENLLKMVVFPARVWDNASGSLVLPDRWDMNDISGDIGSAVMLGDVINNLPRIDMYFVTGMMRLSLGGIPAGTSSIVISADAPLAGTLGCPSLTLNAGRPVILSNGSVASFALVQEGAKSSVTVDPGSAFASAPGSVTLNIPLPAGSYGSLSVSALDADGAFLAGTSASGLNWVISRREGKKLSLTLSDEFPWNVPPITSQLFSVASGKKVRFATSNLMYAGKTARAMGQSTRWRLMKYPWSIVEESGWDASQASGLGDISLLGWGTSGYNGKNPWMHSTTGSDYVPAITSGSWTADSDQWDWGRNNSIYAPDGREKISSGMSDGGYPVLRTLESAEWEYLLSGRSCPYRFASAWVGDMLGLIVFPDEFSMPGSVKSGASPLHLNEGWWDASQDSEVTRYTIEEFHTMALAGAVFLPCSGSRNSQNGGLELGNIPSTALPCPGYYWTATAVSNTNAFALGFDVGGYEFLDRGRGDGYSVRLVQDEIIPVRKITIDQGASLNMTLSESVQLTASVYPSQATDKSLIWGSEHENIASVDLTSGLVTANGPGTTTIYCTNEASGVFATIEITVIASALPPINQAGEFSVSDTKKVHFTNANLMYAGASGTPATRWRIMEHPWSTIELGSGVLSPSENSDFTLFGWATSGYNGKNPWMTSATASDYGPAISSGEWTSDSKNWDWGCYNDIYNYNGTILVSKGTSSNGLPVLRTLSKAEWDYLLGRTDKCGLATVNGQSGAIILPDEWTGAQLVTDFARYDDNIISGEDFRLWSASGAIFLPSAGFRDGTSLLEPDNGMYWTSSVYNQQNAARVLIDGVDLDTYTHYAPPQKGYLVRLVEEIQPVIEAYSPVNSNGLFSVADNLTVRFTNANLMYAGASGTEATRWRIQKYPWSMIEGTDDNTSFTPAENTDFTLFGWATGGYNGKDPWMTSTSDADYGPAISTGDWTSDSKNWDWGSYNNIYNYDASVLVSPGLKDNGPASLRTLTNEEWKYLLEQRANYESKRGLATVNGIPGMIILPDTWSGQSLNTSASDFTDNQYSASGFGELADKGAVFLPASGFRNNSALSQFSAAGYYWTSSTAPSTKAYRMIFPNIRTASANRQFGQSVRLVDDSWDYTLAPISNVNMNNALSSQGGTVNVNVKSYRSRNGENIGVGWKAYALSEAGDGTWVSNDDPNWPSWLSLSGYSGSGNYSGESVGVTCTANDVFTDSVRDLATSGSGANMISNLRSATEVGSQQIPRDLSLYNIFGDLYEGTHASAIPRGSYGSSLQDARVMRAGSHTSNCYIVSAPGWYCFPLIYGNAIDANKTSSGSKYGGNVYTEAYTGFQNANGQDITDPYILADMGLTGSSALDAVVVWQDVPEGYEIIREDPLVVNAPQNAGLTTKYIKFYIDPDNILPGNIVIALRNNGTIIWSWHIWVTTLKSSMPNNNIANTEDFYIWDIRFRNNMSDPSQLTSSQYPYYMLNCDLGWTPPLMYDSKSQRRSTTVKIVPDYGNAAPVSFNVTQGQVTNILYQGDVYSGTYYLWGRKDPFLPGGYIKNGAHANRPVSSKYYTVTSSDNTLPIAAMAGSPIKVLNNITFKTKLISESIKNPHIFLKDDSQGMHMNPRFDLWNFYNGNAATRFNVSDLKEDDYTIIQKRMGKTIYDPCPPGFCVPMGRMFSGFTSDGKNYSSSSNKLYGVKTSWDSAARRPSGWRFSRNGTATQSTWYLHFNTIGSRRYSSNDLLSTSPSSGFQDITYFLTSAPCNSAHCWSLSLTSTSVNPLSRTEHAGFIRPMVETD